MKKWLALGMKISVSGALIWYLLSDIDLRGAWVKFTQVQPALLAGAMVVLLGQLIIAGFRWGAVLETIGAPLPFWRRVRLAYIGVFFNQALPGGTGGDVVRIYLANKTGMGLRAAINGVVLERIATVAGLILLVVATQPLIMPNLDAAARAWVVPSLVIVSMGALAGIGLLCFLDRAPVYLQRWKIVHGLGYLAHDARSLFLHPIDAGRALFWCVLGHLNVSFCVFVLAQGLNLEVTLIECMVLTPPVLLAMTIPISIGGWGVREAAMVVAFGLIGVPAESATVLGILFGLVALAIALPGGFLWLGWREQDRVSLSEVSAEISAEPETESS